MAIRTNNVVVGTLSAVGTAVGDLPTDKHTELAFTVTGLTAETLQILVSCDNGVTYSTSALGVTPITGAAAVTTIPSTSGAGYMVRLPACTDVRFVKSAGAETVTIKYALRSF